MSVEDSRFLSSVLPIVMISLTEDAFEVASTFFSVPVSSRLKASLGVTDSTTLKGIAVVDTDCVIDAVVVVLLVVVGGGAAVVVALLI